MKDYLATLPTVQSENLLCKPANCLSIPNNTAEYRLDYNPTLVYYYIFQNSGWYTLNMKRGWEKGREGGVSQRSITYTSHKTIQDESHHNHQSEQWKLWGEVRTVTAGWKSAAHPITTNKKVQPSVHVSTELWTAAGSYRALFLTVAHLTLFINSAKKSTDPLFCSPTQSNRLHCRRRPHFIRILLLLLYRLLVLLS